mmetsp:Transcript_9038/g.9979  ORF Transcript_9038/g.9979 Transcript_9038/m.9979 type:complete len:185 (+) Transcript_9038:76-630(+)
MECVQEKSKEEVAELMDVLSIKELTNLIDAATEVRAGKIKEEEEKIKEEEEAKARLCWLENNDRITLRTVHNTYIGADENGKLLGDAKEAGAWETFTVEVVGDGKISLKSCHDKYICDDRKFVADRDGVGIWETISPENKGDKGECKIAIRGGQDHYVCVTDKHHVEQRDEAGMWETFTYEKVS